MLLVAPIVLVAALSPVAQQAPPPVAPAAVTSIDMPAASAVDPHLDAGLAAFKKRRFAQAEIEFRKALDANPQSAAAAYYLAYTYYKQAEPHRHDHPGKQKAAAMFDKAYSIDPLFQPVWRSSR
jgi:tetratricopeptide (TPR) repeat protein